jgi:rSAM/selenodomain-associated transferase 2
VIIPTLNEAQRIAGAVAAVREMVSDVIVVDGGSTDDTESAARAAGARVLCLPGASRAVAMNTGAALARAEILYFLHADCRPPEGFAVDIRSAIWHGAGAGCFRLRFDSGHWLLRLSGWLSRVDVDLFRYGDQSLFVRRDVFRTAQGFDERLGVMEDQDLVRRLRRRARFVVLDGSIVASARQYRASGVYRTQLLIYPLVVALHHLGMPQPALVRLYDRLRLPASDQGNRGDRGRKPGPQAHLTDAED